MFCRSLLIHSSFFFWPWSVLLQLTDSDYLFGIFKPFLKYFRHNELCLSVLFYSFVTSEFISSVCGARVARCVVFCVVFCRSLFVPLYFFFMSLYLLVFFDLRLLLCHLQTFLEFKYMYLLCMYFNDQQQYFQEYILSNIFFSDTFSVHMEKG